MKVFKRLLAIVLILLIIAVVLTLVGAGILVLFPNQKVMGLPISWIDRKAQNALDYNAVKDTAFKINKDSLKNNLIIESDAFDITVDYIQPKAGVPQNEDNVYVVIDAKVLGFSKDVNTALKFDVESDTVNNAVKITTTQPKGLLFTNKCSLKIAVTHSNLNEVSIKTNGKITVNEGFSIKKLTINSENKKENNTLVKSSVTALTINNPNGSGVFDTFKGNIVINSDYGSYKINKMVGNLEVHGKSMKINVTELLGSLNYNLAYGMGEFGTILGDASFISENTNVSINKLGGALSIKDTGDSSYTINENGVTGVTKLNSITLNDGSLKLGKSYYKTTINAKDGNIEITEAKNVVEILPIQGGKCEADVFVSFADTLAIGNSVERTLTVTTEGEITAKNLQRQVYIEGLDDEEIYCEFKTVNKVSTIKSKDGDITIKAPNSVAYTIDASSKKADKINMQITNAAPSAPYDENGFKKISYNILGGSSSARLIVQSLSNLNFYSLNSK